MIRELTTLDIEKSLKDNEFTRHMYAGIYPIDLLPSYALPSSQRPAIIVVNQGKSYTAGTHWVMIFLAKNSQSFYFDSFGLKPQLHSNLITFMNRNSSNSWFFNRSAVQKSDSLACGYFVLLAALLCARFQDPSLVCRYFKSFRLTRDQDIMELTRKMYASA